MFTNTLSKNAASALALLGKSDILKDAESQNSPKMLVSISWPKVKEFFQKQAISLAKERLKP